MIRKIQNLIDTTKRFFYWGWKLRNSYDWDYHYLDEIIYLKLKRMKDCFEKHGHSTWVHKKGPGLKRKLDIAVELSNRLCYNDYDEQYNMYLDNKWGEHTFVQEGERFRLSRSKLREEDREKYGEESIRLFRKAHNQKKDERSIRDAILTKYSKHFWD